MTSFSETTSILALLGLQTQAPVAALRQGLPFTAYETMLEILNVPSRVLATTLLVPERTLRRRKSEGLFKPEESDRLFRLARLTHLATRVFEGDADKATAWLRSPKPLLSGESPLEHADTDAGVSEVVDMLYAIEFTMPA